MNIFLYNVQNIQKVRWFASVNRNLRPFEQIAISFCDEKHKRQTLTDPWTDKNGRHNLSDEEAVATWGLGPVSLFIEQATKIIDSLEEIKCIWEKVSLDIYRAIGIENIETIGICPMEIGEFCNTTHDINKTAFIISQNEFEKEPPYHDLLLDAHLVMINNTHEYHRASPVGCMTLRE